MHSIRPNGRHSALGRAPYWASVGSAYCRRARNNCMRREPREPAPGRRAGPAKEARDTGRAGRQDAALSGREPWPSKAVAGRGGAGDRRSTGAERPRGRATAVQGPRQCVQSCRKGSVRPGPLVASQFQVSSRSSSAGGGAASADDGRVKGSCSESTVVQPAVAMADGTDAGCVLRWSMEEVRTVCG